MCVCVRFCHIGFVLIFNNNYTVRLVNFEAGGVVYAR